MGDKGVLSLSQGAYLLLGLPQVGFSDVDGEMCLGFFFLCFPLFFLPPAMARKDL